MLMYINQPAEGGLPHSRIKYITPREVKQTVLVSYLSGGKISHKVDLGETYFF